MQLRPSELSAHLAKGRLLPVYVVHGEEALVALEAAQAIRDAARQQGFSERQVLTVEPGFKWMELAASGQAISLFSEQKLVELRIPNGKPGVEGGEALQFYAASAPVDNVLLVQLPKLDKPQLSSKWFLALEEAGAAVGCAAVSRNELPVWIAERLGRQQQRLSAEAMDYLVARVEGNLLAAKQEIDKLALLHGSGELNLGDMQAAVANVARYDVWGLGEALVAGDAARLSRMLDGLKGEGEAPTLVLWAMADEVRALLKVGLGRSHGGNLQQLYRENRVWGEKQKRYPAALDRLKASQLKAALAHAADIDRIVKGVGSGEAWEELLKLGMRLMPK
ncbi:DNA polymerase III subunit delta [Chitinimonas sp. BJB300]|uniref:DNA polymerase III subunit delta n=1 Tax=Chitinimonas sp. BJB300 TaxID=1559339 RepID=UPI000C11A1A4|nr:DNA polymerase III subunit delta [Chitinimonas sp. BJB300]PHV12633.1 DNA polymerase III subunit delta [Chitinimonas sp. BJB300]TSJ91167.1 DNA polymerase III subunit delta [Chitinimonas sp. BJB300]